MARGTQLSRLLDMLRAEIRDSSDPALGQNWRPALINTLQRHQERLWEDFAWPHLMVPRDVPMAAGQRYYTTPADLDFDRIDKARVRFRYSAQWFPVLYGIGEAEMNISDSDVGARSDPARAWQITEDGTLEVWPIPAANAVVTGTDASGSPIYGDGKMRLHGPRRLKPLAADSDTADLDDRLLTLYAAAEILAGRKQPDAQAKLDMAKQLYARLKGNQGDTETFVMGGGGQEPTTGPAPLLNVVWKPSS